MSTGVRKIDSDTMAERDARLLRLWNTGLTVQLLAQRFGMRAGGVTAILKKFRQQGVEVRTGRA